MFAEKRLRKHSRLFSLRYHIFFYFLLTAFWLCSLGYPNGQLKRNRVPWKLRKIENLQQVSVSTVTEHRTKKSISKGIFSFMFCRFQAWAKLCWWIFFSRQCLQQSNYTIPTKAIHGRVIRILIARILHSINQLGILQFKL